MIIAGLVLIGLLAGVFAGLFGVGGGVVIVPALVYGLGYSQKLATGTSLAILLPPVGIAAVIEYYRNDMVDVRAAVIIAITLLIGAWFGALVANRIDANTLKSLFGGFLMLMGAYVIFETRR